jgi:bifunctional N-acetylglucosamine-1-phosphate-uridyltransferase/glucosamine-1-phosphate-acetyltransferase GlmU-like protein
MKKKENTYSLDGQAVNFSEDFERDYLKDVVYLQADKARTEEEIMQEIIEEENRLPAKITVIYENKPQPDELKDNALPF